MDNLNEITLWVLRHGLRRDFIDKDWVKTAENPYNPPLDPKGLIQAEETALRFKSEKIEHIFASPFLRTLQTAEKIAEKIGLEFNVEPGLSEWLKDNEYNKMPDLDNLNNLKNDFPSINLNYKPFVETEYPEDRKALDERTEEALNKIITKYKTNILIISHGSPIKSIYKNLINVFPETYQPMCSLTRFEYKDQKWTLVIDGDSSHLSIPDTTQRAFYIENGTDYK